jgi:hypothetical protein
MLQYVGKKKAPTSRVGKGADTFVKPTPVADAGPVYDENGKQVDVAGGVSSDGGPRIFSSIPGSADNRPSQPMSNVSRNIDGVFFKEDTARLEARPRTMGTTAKIETGTEGFSRPRMYNVQNKIGNDGLPIEGEQKARLLEIDAKRERLETGKATKKHFKPKKHIKARSGAGYD